MTQFRVSGPGGFVFNMTAVLKNFRVDELNRQQEIEPTREMVGGSLSCIGTKICRESIPFVHLRDFTVFPSIQITFSSSIDFNGFRAFRNLNWEFYQKSWRGARNWRAAKASIYLRRFQSVGLSWLRNISTISRITLSTFQSVDVLGAEDARFSACKIGH